MILGIEFTGEWTVYLSDQKIVEIKYIKTEDMPAYYELRYLMGTTNSRGNIEYRSIIYNFSEDRVFVIGSDSGGVDCRLTQ